MRIPFTNHNFVNNFHRKSHNTDILYYNTVLSLYKYNLQCELSNSNVLVLNQTSLIINYRYDSSTEFIQKYEYKIN